MFRGRALAFATSVALATSLTMAVAATPASATTAVVVCKQLVGNLGGATLSNCSDIANTGGSGTLPFSTPSKITWANGNTTTLNPFGSVMVTSDENETGTCAATTTEYRLVGKVSADTTGSIPVGSKVSAEICVDFTHNKVTNEPGAKFKIT
jgi:hypothetical protein